MMDMHVHELYLHRTANKLFIGTFEKGVYIYDLNSQKIVRPRSRTDRCEYYTDQSFEHKGIISSH